MGVRDLGRALLRRGDGASPVDDYAEPFTSSAEYWDRRYRIGLHSGAGSYDELARFKADVLNGFVREQHVTSVLELGCGDGNQLSLADYPRYLGLDIAAAAIDRCVERFAGDPSKSFFLHDPARFVDRGEWLSADLVLSLDVLFHLVEDEVFDRHLAQVFTSARRWVAIYSSNEALHDDWPHVRHRPFTDVVARRYPQWRLSRTVPNPRRGSEAAAVSDFYFYERAA